MQGSREIFPEGVAFGLQAEIDCYLGRWIGLNSGVNLKLLQCHSPNTPSSMNILGYILSS